MTTVQVLCQRAILLEHGEVKMTGSPKTVISQYISGDFENLAERVWISPSMLLVVRVYACIE
jgi:ABC-type polysaccharide/polyol phosphate transport system ATPase subunit